MDNHCRLQRPLSISKDTHSWDVHGCRCVHGRSLQLQTCRCPKFQMPQLGHSQSLVGQNMHLQKWCQYRLLFPHMKHVQSPGRSTCGTWPLHPAREQHSVCRELTLLQSAHVHALRRPTGGSGELSRNTSSIARSRALCRTEDSGRASPPASASMTSSIGLGAGDRDRPDRCSGIRFGAGYGARDGAKILCKMFPIVLTTHSCNLKCSSADDMSFALMIFDTKWRSWPRTRRLRDRYANKA